jgi:hypothetical protein
LRTAALVAASLIAALPNVVTAQEDPPAPVAAPVLVAPAAEAPAAPAPAAPAARPQKSGGYFGFSFGTGKGTLNAGGSSIEVDSLFGGSGEKPTTFALQLRGGFGNGDLLFGAQMNMTRTWVDVGGTSYGLQFLAVDAVATWWSQDMGMYMRLGVGPSQVSGFGGNSTGDTVQGMEMMVGVGLTMGGLGVGFDVTKQAYDVKEAGFDSVTYVLASFSFDMY